MEKEKEFMKNVNSSKKTLIIGLIILVYAMLQIGIPYFMKTKEMKNEKPMSDTDSSLEAGEYACVDVSYMTKYFATYTVDNVNKEKVYFIFDEELAYVASLDDDDLKKLDKIMKFSYREEDSEMEEPKPVKICGWTKEVPADLKKLAIESYNEIYDEELLKDDNFVDYLGVYYMDSTTSTFTLLETEIIVGGIFALAGLIVLIVYFKNAHTTKKTLSNFSGDFDKIKMDVMSEDTFYNKKAKMYLTRDYLITFASGFQIYNYKDIIWVYPFEYRRNGYVQSKSIYVITSDKKTHVIAQLSAGKKNMLVFDEIYNNLLLRVPNAMHGYTKENKDKLKEMTKK